MFVFVGRDRQEMANWRGFGEHIAIAYFRCVLVIIVAKVGPAYPNRSPQLLKPDASCFLHTALGALLVAENASPARRVTTRRLLRQEMISSNLH